MVDQKIKQTLKVAAGMGKGGDQYVGHLAHGEIILSNAFQKEYSGLIDDLRKAFERVGINMNRYIVGHKENRINSETGMPMYAEGIDGGGEGPGGSGGYGDGGGEGVGGEGVGGEGVGGEGGGGDGGGGGGGNEDNSSSTPIIPEEKAKPTFQTPLTPQNMGTNLGYDPIPSATFTPATPTTLPPTTSFQQFAGGGLVDAALKKVSNKFTDTGLPLNAMEILSKIARTG
jgi:hypothetical protein